MATTYIKCCGKLHEVIQFTYKGPIQYGAECSVCGRRVAASTPEDVGWKWEQMNPKPLDAGLAERLRKTYCDGARSTGYLRLNMTGWLAVADYVRRLVKEAKEGE